MTILAFYVGGVASAAFGAVKEAKFAHVLVGTPATDKKNTVYIQTIAEINYEGDSNFGKVENKFLSYGWMSCNTEVGGVKVGTDAGGRTLPLHIAGKHVEINVDSGTTFSGFNKVKTVFKVHDMDASGNKGALLFEFDGIMNIWSGRMSSDAKIVGRLKPITGDTRVKVANQVLQCAAKQ